MPQITSHGRAAREAMGFWHHDGRPLRPAFIPTFRKREDQIARRKIAIAVPITFGPCRIPDDGVLVLTRLQRDDEIGRIELTVQVCVSEISRA